METAVGETLERTFELVASTPNLAADTVLAGVLTTADEPIQRLALNKLFERGNPTGLALLVGHFSRLHDGLKRLILDRIDDLHEATRLTVANESVEARLGAIELIRRGRSSHLAYLLSEALARQCPRTKEAAATVLLELVRHALEPRERASDGTDSPHLPAPNGDQEARLAIKRLADAVCRALDCWRLHFRPEILTAAMWLIELTEGKLFKLASSPRTGLARALNETFRSSHEAWTAGYALRALSHPDLRAAAAWGITTSNDHRFIERLLDAMWITFDPSDGSACSYLRGLEWLNGGIEALTALPPRRARAAVRLVALSSIPQDQKLGFLRQMISDGSPVLAEAAMWYVAEMETPPARDLLGRIAQTECGAIREMADHDLFRRDPHAALHGHGVADRHRGLAPEDEWRGRFEVYWREFDQVDDKTREDQSKQLMAQESRFIREVRAKLTDADAQDRRRALNLIRSAGLTDQFEEQVFARSHDADETVRSLAVHVLGEMGGATARRIVRQALSDPDERVQANAIEALELLEPNELFRHLEPKLISPSNRVRANAVKALLRLRATEAAHALLKMLEDPSSASRTSALWVVDRLRLGTLWLQVHEMARNDSDERIRSRAQRVLEQLPLSGPERVHERSGEPR